MLITPQTRQTRTLDIPHEPGQTITIQRLSWAELPMRTTSADTTAYMLALFKAAIVSWSYPVPVADNIQFLDDVTAGWLYVEIDKFVHHVDHEANRGNATAPSTAS